LVCSGVDDFDGDLFAARFGEHDGPGPELGRRREIVRGAGRVWAGRDGAGGLVRVGLMHLGFAAAFSASVLAPRAASAEVAPALVGLSTRAGGRGSSTRGSQPAPQDRDGGGSGEDRG
jgi:hypothetical protein